VLVAVLFLVFLAIISSSEVIVTDGENLSYFILPICPTVYDVTQSGKKDSGNFAKIEALLGDRPYTVFSAHTHVYNYDVRNGRDYITTSTSGGVSFVRPGAMDHVVWITMSHEGPKIVNLLLNGIMGKQGPPKDDALEEIGLYRPRG